jgi:hypothetical protein
MIAFEWPINQSLGWSSSVAYSLLVVVTLLLTILFFINRKERGNVPPNHAERRDGSASALFVSYTIYAAAEVVIQAFGLNALATVSLVANVAMTLFIIFGLRTRQRESPTEFPVDNSSRRLMVLIAGILLATSLFMIPHAMVYWFILFQGIILIAMACFNRGRWLSLGLLRSLLLFTLLSLMTFTYSLGSLGTEIPLVLGLSTFFVLWVALQSRIELGRWSLNETR